MGNSVEKILLTHHEAAEALSVSERTLARLVKSGTVPVVRFPGGVRTVRYSVDAIRAVVGRLQSTEQPNGHGDE